MDKWEAIFQPTSELETFMKKFRLPAKIHRCTVQPVIGAKPGKCYNNCMDFEHGTWRTVMGWTVARYREYGKLTGIYLFEHHAVMMNSNGGLWDITPDPKGWPRKTFIIDERMKIEEFDHNIAKLLPIQTIYTGSGFKKLEAGTSYFKVMQEIRKNKK